MRARVWLPVTYILIAVYAWVDFMRINPDGLANVGLMLVVFPVTIAGLLLGLALGRDDFVLSPDGFGYFGDHALYYVPSVILVAALLWRLGLSIDRRRGIT
jgi:hypothetical protein